MMNLKTLFYSLMALGLFCQGTTQAQLLGPYGTSPITFEVDANGLLSDTGTFGTGSLSLSGTGTRMFWYPGKAAFRAGTIDWGNSWDDANIGTYSASFGENTMASGASSFAEGSWSTASGDYSFAANEGYASGAEAFAAGGGYASGSNSVAIQYATASGYFSFAWGWDATASGSFSMSLGSYTSATGQNSLATGTGTVASGASSLAMDNGTTASGNDSAAFNLETQAQSYCSTTFGRYNVGGYGTGGQTTWLSADPLFEIGNGTYSAPADALVVYKNGTVAVHTVLRCAAGGDISMGSFTAGTAP